MSKVGEVVQDALQYLGVLDAAGPVSAEDMQTGIRQLNMMMRRWEANLLSLGWNDVDNPDEDMPVPPEAEEAIGYNLALRLNARFKVPLGEIADVIELARSGYATLLRDQEVATPIQPILDAPWADSWGADYFRSSAWYF